MVMLMVMLKWEKIVVSLENIEIIIINLELDHKIPIAFHNLKDHDSYIIMEKLGKFTLREMCPNTKFFLIRIFPHSHWIRRDISVFSPNAGKYGPEKTLYLDTFHAMLILK